MNKGSSDDEVFDIDILFLFSEGEDLVSEPQDEMEELQGEGAAVDGRLSPADAPHQNQPPPRPH